MGPLSKIFGMLPGMGEMKEQINSIDEREVDRLEAIIYSMTPAERDNVKILDGSRRARIAKGAGVQVSDVNNLVNRFVEARKMMSQLAGGGFPGMPGMPGMPGAAGPGGKRKPQQAKGKNKGRKVSGNPAKRNPGVAAAAAPANPLAAFGQQGSPADIDPAELEKAMGQFQLPPDVMKRLKS
jgi:signal recognition particle subunit SRP54